MKRDFFQAFLFTLALLVIFGAVGHMLVQIDDPEPPTPVLGACCVKGPESWYECFLVTEERCDQYTDSWYEGVGRACNPNPCR